VKASLAVIPWLALKLQRQQPVVRVVPPPAPGLGQPLPLPLPQRPGPSLSAGVEWVTVRDVTGAAVEARGACIENMVRAVFDISNLEGTKARIVIEDRATGTWGRINADDIWLTASYRRANHHSPHS
jgi:hypothetical protein